MAELMAQLVEQPICAIEEVRERFLRLDHRKKAQS